ncbi:hypothetical protein ACH5RR_018816 [Cinchona calisaya]|uniref:GAG-pre-integrase domain-containing protein n=1 Tax=Cinchona calisaya TaxID=153742 RepID=A0ABD2ZR79_9GENT
MSAQETYVDKTRKNETVDLWHARLDHVSYYKLKIMMKKSMLKDLPQLEFREDTVCAGCQYDQLGVSSIKSQFDAYSLDMIIKENVGDVVIPQLENAMSQGMWCSMKHHLGGL